MKAASDANVLLIATKVEPADFPSRFIALITEKRDGLMGRGEEEEGGGHVRSIGDIRCIGAMRGKRGGREVNIYLI